MKTKVCGMKYPGNMAAVAAHQPQYLGLHFYPESPRNALPILTAEDIPNSVMAIGVFVNTNFDAVMDQAKRYGLKAVQLHGAVPPDLCQRLRACGLEVFLAIPVGAGTDLDQLAPYADCVDYFLFDVQRNRGTAIGEDQQKTPQGYSDFGLLDAYAGSTPYFLSGGIAMEDLPELRKLQDPRCVGIDLGHRFEAFPGFMVPDRIGDFIRQLSAAPALSRV